MLMTISYASGAGLRHRAKARWKAHGTRTPRKPASVMAFWMVPPDRIRFTNSSTHGWDEALHGSAANVNVRVAALRQDVLAE
jgi:hypothetical protein